jgi:phosphoribosyl-ATP pyrophosphohydrolase
MHGRFTKDDAGGLRFELADLTFVVAVYLIHSGLGAGENFCKERE